MSRHKFLTLEHMKTTKFGAFMVVVAALCVSCGQKTTKQAEEQSEQQTVQQAEPQFPYLSSDLRLLDLKGNVESVTMDFHTQVFDEKGLNITPDMRIERDGEGRIVLYTFDPMADVGDMWFQEEFEYDRNGNISKYHKSSMFNDIEARCFFDEDGHLQKMYADGCYEDGGQWSMDINYSILESDANGNWVKRNAHTVFKETGSTKEDDKTESREIVYRK